MVFPSLFLLPTKHAMNRRCAFLHISDPKQRCKLFDSLVLPILSYASEVWFKHVRWTPASLLLHVGCTSFFFGPTTPQLIAAY